MNRNYLFLKFSSAFSTIWDSLSWFLQTLSLLAFFLSLRLFLLLYHSKDPLIWQPLKYWCPRSKYSPFILNNVSSQFRLHSWFKPTTHLLTSTSVFPAYTLVLNSCVIYLIAVSCLVDKSCLTLCEPMDCSPTGSSIHGILLARKLKWVAISFSRGSSQHRDWAPVSCISRQILNQEESSQLSQLGSPNNW